MKKKKGIKNNVSRLIKTIKFCRLNRRKCSIVPESLIVIEGWLRIWVLFKVPFEQAKVPDGYRLKPRLYYEGTAMEADLFDENDDFVCQVDWD